MLGLSKTYHEFVRQENYTIYKKFLQLFCIDYNNKRDILPAHCDIIELIQEEIINQLYFEINVIRKGLKDKIKVLIEDKPLSFSFNGNIDKLKNTLKQLQLNIDLLNNDSKIDYLFEVFTTDDLSNYYDEIVIGCDTKQFAYVLKSLHFYFNNLTMKSIEDCRLFKSKNNTIILANNLYSKGQMTPKKSADIDKAINLMK